MSFISGARRQQRKKKYLLLLNQRGTHEVRHAPVVAQRYTYMQAHTQDTVVRKSMPPLFPVTPAAR